MRDPKLGKNATFGFHYFFWLSMLGLSSVINLGTEKYEKLMKKVTKKVMFFIKGPPTF